MKEIKCEFCHKDLSTTGNSEDWRLCVSSEFITSDEGSVTDMHIPQPISKTTYFCDFKCLKCWMQ